MSRRERTCFGAPLWPVLAAVAAAGAIAGVAATNAAAAWPGADAAGRVRASNLLLYQVGRDLDGAVAEIDRGPLRATLLAGEPVRYPENPPSLVDAGFPRRQGAVSGGHAAARLHRGLEIGLGYLRIERVTADGLEELGGIDLTLCLPPLIPALRERGAGASLYAEYAGRSWRPFSDGLDTGDDVPHALYTATELSYGRWGLSYETKDYRDFALGVNDPPNLVPEMRQHLLDRMSHSCWRTTSTATSSR